MALTLVHTADWHLGMRFRSFREEDERELMRARLVVIERLLGVADRHQADAVLAAGDLFDGPKPDRQWWEGLADVLARRATPGRPVFLLPGNHDPLIADSVWDPTSPFRKKLPPHVHVVDRDDFSYALSEGAIVYAAPCRSSAGQKDLALSLPAREPGDERIRVGMVHGSTFDIPSCQTNFPIAQDAALRRGFDYLAIGDTHGFRVVPPDAKVPTVYPGAPEATSFGDMDPGHVAIVFITACTGRKWPGLPIESGHRFRLKVDSDSDGIRPATEGRRNGCPDWIGMGVHIGLESGVGWRLTPR